MEAGGRAPPVHRPENTGAFLIILPVKPEEKVFWESVLNKTHEQFIAQVKHGRGDRLKETPAICSVV